MKTIYISGSLTNGGTKKLDPRAHNKMARILRKMGNKVFNPAELEQKTKKSWEWYLSRDLLWIEKHKPMMMMLTNWKESLGARLEHELALRLKLTIIYEI